MILECSLFDGKKIHQNARIEIEANKYIQHWLPPFPSQQVVSHKNPSLLIFPEVVDLHCNGAVGYSFELELSDSQIEEMLKYFRQFHQYRLVPTIVSSKDYGPFIENCRKLKKANAYLGCHLEGPFLDTKFPGVHPKKRFLKAKDYPKFKEKVVKPLRELGPVLMTASGEFWSQVKDPLLTPSLGHCSWPKLENHVKAITHTFNAMPSLHHRTPHFLWEALIKDSVAKMMIIDGRHLQAQTMDFLKKTCTNLIYVSDLSPFAGLKKSKEVYWLGQNFEEILSELHGALSPLYALFKSMFETKEEIYENIAKISSKPLEFLGESFELKKGSYYGSIEYK